ncbi:hypothetical protein [Mesorhizobium sp. L2C084A000]|nr:hypothetical protein [Mesorhizobium sp. L2C084A000]
MARQTLALAHELSSQRADQWSGLRRAANRSAGGSPRISSSIQ